jgi:hypothetical protein
MTEETGTDTGPVAEPAPSGSTGGSWRDMIGAAKQRAKELTGDERAQQAIAKASAGAEVASRHFDATRKKVTQEETWSEVTTAIEELVQVTLAQQQLIEGLVARVEALEAGRVDA